MIGRAALALFVGSFLTLLPSSGCDRDEPAADVLPAISDAGVELVGYDIRRLRPVANEPLAAMFTRVFERAASDGKRVAVLFSAGWCEACRALTLELGNMHPADTIGDVRILELKEEDWEPATRMDEYNALRSRFHPVLRTYPLFVMLDEHGDKVEEMREARVRLEAMGARATVPNWFQSLPAR
jgi:hypothetical protein